MRRCLLISMICLFLFGAGASAELLENGDGTVTDTKSGLMWQQAEAGAMTWKDALVYCENATLAGYDDWRLPNRNELQSLLDYSRYEYKIDMVAFPWVMSSYWSSTTYADNSDHAWCVGFPSGSVFDNNKSNSYYVRAVRGGQ